jgi:hypothetical protein
MVVADPQLGSGGQQPELTVTHLAAGLCVIEVRCELDMDTGPSPTRLFLQEVLDVGATGSGTRVKMIRRDVQTSQRRAAAAAKRLGDAGTLLLPAR